MISFLTTWVLKRFTRSLTSFLRFIIILFDSPCQNIRAFSGNVPPPGCYRLNFQGKTLIKNVKILLEKVPILCSFEILCSSNNKRTDFFYNIVYIDLFGAIGENLTGTFLCP
uniref:Uncharacterized protein n=1 Tax=Cacopsylla melanoneura TaxID=428564 RepID=A0A8D9E977_9HEMI